MEPSDISEAIACFQAGDYQGAIERAEPLTDDPDQAHVAFNLIATSLAAQENYEAALEAHAKCIERRPDYPPGLSNYASTLLAMGDFAKAIETYRSCLTMDPAIAAAQRNLLVAYQRSGRLEEAEAFLADQAGALSEVERSIFTAEIGLARGKFEAVVETAQTFAEDPDYSHVAFDLMATGLAGLGRYEEALELHRRCLETQPDYVRGMRNLAATLLNTKHFNEAIIVGQRVLAAEPDSVPACRNLIAAHCAAGQIDDAETLLADMSDRLTAVQRHILGAKILVAKGAYDEAMEVYTALVDGGLEDADQLANMAHVAVLTNDYGRAEWAARKALDMAPDNAAALANLGTVLYSTDREDEAEHILRRAVSLAPNSATAHSMLGQIAVDQGELGEARQHFESALTFDPDELKTLAGMAQLGALTTDSDIGRRLRELSERPLLRWDDEALICFTLAELTHREAAYEEAAAFLGRANRAVAARCDWDEEADATLFDQVRALNLSPEIDADGAAGSNGEAVPIFIVGFPRSGTSLTEQILGVHPDIHALGELPHMVRLLERVAAEGFVETKSVYGDAYISHTADKVPAGTRYFTDKLPENYQALSLIKTIFPAAKIVHLRRQRNDVLLSVYRKYFKYNLDYAYSLKDIAKKYDLYRSYMATWDELPGLDIHHIDYETLVDDFAAEVRRLLDYLDLPFDESCLDFWQSTQRVKTASRYQVRSPIHANSVDLWRQYPSLFPN